jgi:hypothetical protein
MKVFRKDYNVKILFLMGMIFYSIILFQVSYLYSYNIDCSKLRVPLKEDTLGRILQLLGRNYGKRLLGFQKIPFGDNAIVLLVVHSSKKGSCHVHTDKENIIILDFEEIVSEANKEGISLSFSIRRVFLEELGHAVDDIRIKREEIDIKNIIRQGSPLELYINENSSDDLRNDLLEIIAGLRMILLADSDFEVKRLLVKLSRTASDYSDKKHFQSARFVFKQIMEHITSDSDHILYLANVISGNKMLPKASVIRRIAKNLFVENLQYLEPDGQILPYINNDGSEIIVPSILLETLSYIYALFEKQTGGAYALEEAHNFSAIMNYLQSNHYDRTSN